MNINFSKKGFTLIELLIVMAIIGILISLMTVGLGVARKTSRDTQRKTDLEKVRQGLELYNADCNSYPRITLDWFAGPLVGNGTGNCLSSNIYIPVIPNDPISTQFYYYFPAPTPTPPSTAPATSYELCASLENMPEVDVCDGATNCGSRVCNYSIKGP